MVTVFSAPNYCGEFDNCGAMMSVDDNLMCSFRVFSACPFHSQDAKNSSLHHRCSEKRLSRSPVRTHAVAPSPASGTQACRFQWHALGQQPPWDTAAQPKRVTLVTPRAGELRGVFPFRSLFGASQRCPVHSGSLDPQLVIIWAKRLLNLAV